MASGQWCIDVVITESRNERKQLNLRENCFFFIKIMYTHINNTKK